MKEDVDSFLSTVTVFLAGVLLIKLADPHNLSQGKLWSDSWSCIDRLQEINLNPNSHKQTLEKEYPIFNIIRRLLFRRNGNPHIHWVESHTNTTSKETRLNVVADELATIQHSAQGKWASKNNRKFLPNQRAQLVLQADIYERDYNKKIV